MDSDHTHDGDIGPMPQYNASTNLARLNLQVKIENDDCRVPNFPDSEPGYETHKINTTTNHWQLDRNKETCLQRRSLAAGADTYSASNITASPSSKPTTCPNDKATDMERVMSIRSCAHETPGRSCRRCIVTCHGKVGSASCSLQPKSPASSR